MDDCRKAIRALADAVRILADAQADTLSRDDRSLIAGCLRDAGLAIGDQTLATDALDGEVDPPE